MFRIRRQRKPFCKAELTQDTLVSGNKTYPCEFASSADDEVASVSPPVRLIAASKINEVYERGKSVNLPIRYWDAVPGQIGAVQGRDPGVVPLEPCSHSHQQSLCFFCLGELQLRQLTTYFA